jgi:hypothetical protein
LETQESDWHFSRNVSQTYGTRHRNKAPSIPLSPHRTRRNEIHLSFFLPGEESFHHSNADKRDPQCPKPSNQPQLTGLNNISVHPDTTSRVVT